MTISMSSASQPVFAKMLGNMLKWMEAAKAHAEAKKFDPAVYLAMRLAPDMLPFTRQIQIASDAAKGCVARLSGQTAPSWADEETSFDELVARIQKTLDYVQLVPASAIDGSEERDITVPRRQGEALQFKGEAYLKHFAMPNFYFHVTMTYALLRHAGVPLGKPDYLGSF